MTADADSSTGETDGPERSPVVTRARALRWLALCSPLLVPWVVVRTTGTTLVFPWGMWWLEGGSLVPLHDYLDRTTGLPRHLRMWPIAVLCYVLALATAAGRRFGAGQRVASGLLALAGIAAAWMATGLGVGPNRLAIPTGSLLLFALAVWLYVSPVRGEATGSSRCDASDSRGRDDSDSRGRDDSDSRRGGGSDPARERR